MIELKYTLKVWLTAVVLLPLLVGMVFILMAIINSDHSEDYVDPFVFEAVMFSMLYGAILSFPSAAILWLIVYLISRHYDIPVVKTKVILSFAGICLSALPFIFITGMLFLGLPYAGVIVAGVWIYKLQHPTPQDHG